MKPVARFNIILLIFVLFTSIAFLLNRVIWQNLYLFSNSDFLYIPAFVRDYMEGVYDWRLWVLPPSPSFFPDLFFFFLFGFISSDLIISCFVYAFLFSVACIYFISSVFRLTEEYFSFIRIFKAVTLFFALWVFIISFYPEDLGLFFIPSYHGSSFLFSVILYRLLFTAGTKQRIFLFITISVFAITSEKQILYTFFFPVLVTSILLRNASVEKYFTRTFIYLILSFLLSTILLKVLAYFAIFQIPAIPIWTELKKNIFQFKAIENIKMTYPEMKQFFWDLYFDKFVLFLLFLISIVLNFYYSLPISKAKFGVRFLSQCILWVYFFSIFSQLFFGVWGGFRYMWAIYLFPYLSILYYSGNALSQMIIDRNFRNIGTTRRYVFLLSRNKSRSQNFFLAVLFLFVLIGAYFLISTRTTKISFNSPYPPFILCLDRIKDKYNLDYGLSDYWNAKHIRYLSQKNLKVNQVYGNIEKYDWVHNHDWYNKDREGKPIEYNFIIPERLDSKILATRFGSPSAVENCEGKEIFVYEKRFRY